MYDVSSILFAHGDYWEIFVLPVELTTIGGQIAKAIYELRLRLGLTQYSFAIRLGTRERNVQRWESGEALPNADTLIRLLQMCPDNACLKAFGLDCRRFQTAEGKSIDEVAGTLPKPRQKRPAIKSK